MRLVEVIDIYHEKQSIKKLLNVANYNNTNTLGKYLNSNHGKSSSEANRVIEEITNNDNRKIVKNKNNKKDEF